MNNLKQRENGVTPFKVEASIQEVGHIKKARSNQLMRKLTMVGLIVLFCSTLSFGQFKMGAIAGINASTQSGIGNIWDNDGLRCNFNVGILPQYKVNDWFAIKTGMIYSRKGRSIDVEKNGRELTQSEKFNYLEIPVKAEFSALSGKKDHRLFASVGPYTGLLLSSKRNVDDHTYDIEGETYDTDFGLSIGFGVEIPYGENSLQFLLNYDMGLSEVAKYDTDLRNKSLSLSVGWYF